MLLVGFEVHGSAGEPVRLRGVEGGLLAGSLVRQRVRKGVPGGQRTHQRSQRQGEREVPRPDDQHHAVGLVLDPAAAGQLRLLQQPVAALGPLPDVLGGVAGLRRGGRDVPPAPHAAPLATRTQLPHYLTRMFGAGVKPPASATLVEEGSNVHVFARAYQVASYGTASERAWDPKDRWLGPREQEQMFALFFRGCSRGHTIAEELSGVF